MNPEISLIIPVFNKAEFIDECLESVLNQSFTGIEVICIDDHSTDSSLENLKRWSAKDARLHIVPNPVNLGAGQSRNVGISEAQGRYVRFIDADDILPSNSLELLHSAVSKNHTDLARGSIGLFDERGPGHHTHIDRVPANPLTNMPSQPALWIPWWHTSYLISRDIIDEHNIRYPDLIRGEDPVFLAAVLVNAKNISLVEDVVYHYRKYAKPSGSGGKSFEHAIDNLKHAKRVKELFCQENPKYWSEGYGPFLQTRIKHFLSQCQLSKTQDEIAKKLFDRVWPNDKQHIVDSAPL